MERNDMDRPMPSLAFKGMAWMFKIRDRLVPREGILQEVHVRPGDHVLDYGCGPGSYVPLASERAGAEGRVYALDLHPLAIKRVQELVGRRRLHNVETIRSDCQTGLPDQSVDVVLLYDIFHMLDRPETVLAELHRVLKPGGTLSVMDPHMREQDLLLGITAGGRFRLAHKGTKTISFVAV